MFKEFIKEFYKSYYKEDLVQYKDCPVLPLPQKTSGEKLYDLAFMYMGVDPTPKDEVPDEISCVFSLTTILKKMYPDFPVLTYTPKLVEQLQNDKRFKLGNELKSGNIIVFPTESGNNKIMGHTFICGKEGKMLSNSSATGEWSDKYDTNSMIERYSRMGQLKMYIFEII